MTDSHEVVYTPGLDSTFYAVQQQTAISSYSGADIGSRWVTVSVHPEASEGAAYEQADKLYADSAGTPTRVIRVGPKEETT